eukprot:402611_1
MATVASILDTLIETFSEISSYVYTDPHKLQIDTVNLKCICNGVLIPYKARQIHGGNVGCDECDISGRENMDSIFWHCPKEQTDEHRYGYDACNNCYLQKCLHQYNINRERKLRYSQENDSDQTQENKDVKCICNGILSQYKVSDLNSPSSNHFKGRVICEMCGVIGSLGTIFWHCSMRNDLNIHPDINGIASTLKKWKSSTKYFDGYNICNQCHLATEQNAIDNTKYDAINICTNELDCDYINNFAKLMKTYDNNTEHLTQNMDTKMLQNVVNDYLHLIHYHDNDIQFEFISKQLGK